MQNSHPLQLMQKSHFLYGFIDRYYIYILHRTLIKAIGCVTGVIEFLC